MRRSFETASRKSGIENPRFHGLLHTFASNLVMAKAADVGLSQTYVGRLLAGTRELTFSHVERFSEALGVPVSALLLFMEDYSLLHDWKLTAGEKRGSRVFEIEACLSEGVNERNRDRGAIRRHSLGEGRRGERRRGTSPLRSLRYGREPLGSSGSASTRWGGGESSHTSHFQPIVSALPIPDETTSSLT